MSADGRAVNALGGGLDFILLLADAVPRTKGEWLQGGLIVVDVPWVVHPSRRDKLVGVTEVQGGAEGRPMGG